MNWLMMMAWAEMFKQLCFSWVFTSILRDGNELLKMYFDELLDLSRLWPRHLKQYAFSEHVSACFFLCMLIPLMSTMHLSSIYCLGTCMSFTYNLWFNPKAQEQETLYATLSVATQADEAPTKTRALPRCRKCGERTKGHSDEKCNEITQQRR